MALRIETITFELQYKHFDAGELVRKRLPGIISTDDAWPGLEGAAVYTVAKCVPPSSSEDCALVFVVGNDRAYPSRLFEPYV